MSKGSVNDNLVHKARNGDKTAMNELVAELAPIVEIIASKNVGKCSLTRSDLIQEGMIGLLGAVYGYKADGDASFRTYASTCIANGIHKAIEKQSARKHMPLNTYVPIDDIDEKIDFDADPQALLSIQCGIIEIEDLIQTELSPLEGEVIRLRLTDQSNSSIAETLSVSEKTVDNALQRARKKLKGKLIL